MASENWLGGGSIELHFPELHMRDISLRPVRSYLTEDWKMVGE